jgi:hypothetical protein
VIPPSTGKPELIDSDALDQELQMQLELKRAEWKQASGRYHTIRTLSFLFLFLVILGALLAFFFAFTRLQH